MPYEWRARPDGGAQVLVLWPHRSLPRRGFVGFIGATAGLAAIPLLALIGTVHLWMILPFVGLAIWGLWAALRHSYRDGAVVERLTLSATSITLERNASGRATQHWQAAPYWITPILHQDHKIPAYLSLRGGPREVELGAFLSPQERQALYHDLSARLATLRQPVSPQADP